MNIYTHIHIHRHKLTDKAGTHADRHRDGQTDTEMDRQTQRRTDRQTHTICLEHSARSCIKPSIAFVTVSTASPNFSAMFGSNKQMTDLQTLPHMSSIANECPLVH